MERFQSLRKASKIDKNEVNINIISATQELGSKYSKQSYKYQIERSQQITLDNKRWIIFNIDDKNNSNIPSIQRKMPQLMKENTEPYEKKWYKDHHKKNKFQLRFASIDNNNQPYDSFIQAKSKCSNKNVSPLKNIISLRSMKKDVALTECSSYQSPSKKMNKPSIYKYFDKPSKSHKSNGSLLRQTQESPNKSQIKSKKKVDTTQKCLNKRKNQPKSISAKAKKQTNEQTLKQQVKQIVNKQNQKQIQFLILFDPIQLLQKHGPPRNIDFNLQQRQFWKQVNIQQQKETEKQKQNTQKYPLDQFKDEVIDGKLINQDWNNIVYDYIVQVTNYIVQNIEKIEQKKQVKISQKQQIIINKGQIALTQYSSTLNDKSFNQRQNTPCKNICSPIQQKINKSQFEQNLFYSELKAIENIRIIKLECGIGSSLIPQKIEESFINPIPSSSPLHKKYRNNELINLLNTIILINPKIIKNIFIPSINGYSCKLFYNGNAKIVEVDSQFAFDLNYYPIFGEAGQFLWFSVLIKALAIILGSFEAVTLLKAEEAFTMITNQMLHRLSFKNQQKSLLQIIQQNQKEKAQDKILMVRKDEFFYSIAKLNKKKQKISQIQKAKTKIRENNRKEQQKCYKSLSQFLKKQSSNYMKKKLYNETKVELKERSNTHKVSLNNLIEEGYEIIVSESMLSREQLDSIRKNISTQNIFKK